MVNYIGQSNEDRSVEKTDEEPLLQQIWIRKWNWLACTLRRGNECIAGHASMLREGNGSNELSRNVGRSRWQQ